MECSPFCRGFLPGILIGVFSSILLFNTLWRSQSLVRTSVDAGSKSKIPWEQSPNLNPEELAVQPPESLSLYAERGARRVRGEGNAAADCDPSIYLKTQAVDNSSYLLLVLIHSSPRATEVRNAIRATWLSNQGYQKRYAAKFVIGAKDLKPKDVRQLACENKEYGDLLLLPDTYDPVKAQEWSSAGKLLQSFKWAMDNVNFSYILKCTDSTFAILDTILNELELAKRKNTPGDLLWGFFAGGVQAVKDGRLSEKNWFLCSHYLPFPQGGGYVISRSLVSLLRTLEGDLQHYTHDDIGLGVWISPFSGIKKLHDVRFNTGYYSRGCNNAYIITHKETVTSMMQKYVTLKQTGSICKHEFLSRLSYVYNWTVTANRCCVRTPGIP